MLNKLKGTKSPLWAFIDVFFWAIVFTCLILSFSAKSTVGSWTVFKSFFYTPLVFGLNFFPVFAITAILFFITNKMWVSKLISAILFTSVAWINYFKIVFRNDPFVASDFLLAGEAMNMMGGRYDFVIDSHFFIMAGILAIGIILSKLFIKFRFNKYRYNLISAVVGILIFSLCIKPIYFSKSIYDKSENMSRNKPYLNALNTKDQYLSRGTVYSFIHSITDVVEIPPIGYKEDYASDILKNYTYENIPEDKKVHIIAVMLEAFTDLSKYDTIRFSKNPYTYFNLLKKDSVYGEIFTNSFGGGTINSERSFVTGFYNQTEYNDYTPSYVTYFKEQGYTVEGGHPGFKWFYKRDIVNKFLGYDNYYFFEDVYENIYNSNPNSGDGILYDEYLFDDIISKYEKNLETGKPYFNFSVTYQNHGPYHDSRLLNGVEYVKKGGASDSAYYIVNNYLGGIEKTTEAIKKLVTYFEAQNEPVVLVFFGDHNPWLGYSSEGYTDYGINIDFTKENGLENYYKTPYIIHANDKAREVLGNDVRGFGGDFSVMYLMNKLFEVNGWGGNEFIKATNRLKEHIDTISVVGMYGKDGKMTDTLSEIQAFEYENYNMVQYYWKHDKLKDR